MTQALRVGTQGYSHEAPDLLRSYEMRSFEESHPRIVHLIPPAPLRVLDIGAGTGRDAAWFAARGDRVTALEPTREMREGAMTLHPSPSIAWIDDGLPELTSVHGRVFDLVWLSAVWMHFDASERVAMFPRVAALVAPAGSMMILLRHGPVPEGRRMFEVKAEEVVAQGKDVGLTVLFREEAETDRRPGVRWTRLWLSGI